jgi:signal transduction histidine kinase
MNEDGWLIVLRPDGSVLDVGGGAPEWWRGHLLAVCLEALPDVLGDARRLLEARSDDGWCRRVLLRRERAPHEVELLVIDAVPLRRAPTPLIDLLTRTTETLVEQARMAEITLKIATDEQMPALLHIDGEKIAWGVANLIGSALRHVASSPSASKVVSVEARYDKSARRVTIAVHDNGPGIDDKKLRSLLSRDPATNQAGGLALVLLQDVMMAHGGHVMIESSTRPARHGTTVTLVIPHS